MPHASLLEFPAATTTVIPSATMALTPASRAMSALPPRLRFTTAGSLAR